MSREQNNKNTVVVELHGQYCKGCGLCVSVCELNKIEIDSGTNERGLHPARIRAEVLCSGCMKCSTMCPEAAIEIFRIKADIPSADPADKDDEDI